jgi:membrane-bound metal-dependent hydrolase YbcI (DUF457 family)
VVLGAAALWRSRRDVMLGIALGLAIHFWRDMSEADAGVALLWPWSDHSFTLSHAGYLVVMALFCAVAALRCRRGPASMGPTVSRRAPDDVGRG